MAARCRRCAPRSCPLRRAACQRRRRRTQALDIAWLADEALPPTTSCASSTRSLTLTRAWIGSGQDEGGSARTSATQEPRRLSSSVWSVHGTDARRRAGVRRLTPTGQAPRGLPPRQPRHADSDAAQPEGPGRVPATTQRRLDMPTTYDAGATWRPFQLGFFLTTLRGLVDPTARAIGTSST